MSVIVQYTKTPSRSYDYLVNVGFHNGIVNLRTYSPIPAALTINHTTASHDEAESILAVIRGQFSHEAYQYTISSFNQ